MQYTIHVPVEQYGYIEGTYNTIPGAIEGYREISKAWKAPVEPENTSNLQPVAFMRLLYKRLCNEGLEMEEIEGLGTDKMYSQRDVHKIIESLIAKSKREANGGRINKEEDIRYVSETYTNHYNDLKRE